MDPSILIFSFSVFFFSAFLKGITGLGFSTICLPILCVAIDIKTAIPMVILPSIASNLLVMAEAGRFGEAWGRFRLLYLSALPGLILGLSLLGSVASAVPRTVLGMVLVSYAIWALSRKQLLLPRAPARALKIPVGLTTGFINGLTGSQVMPVLPYLISLNLDKNLFVQSINIHFTLSSLVMLLGLGSLGLLTPSLLLTALVGVIPVALGIKLGGLIRKRLSPGIYRRLVLFFLILVGLNLLIGIRY